jgi:predicted phage-related endonuclease
MLTADQIEKRKGKLTASRVACLMTGNAEQILQLYEEMIGARPEEDLSQVWAVRLGESTEALQLEWYQLKNPHLLGRQGEVVVHPQHEWAACTLDGWDFELQCPVEVKHVGGREPLEVVIDRYQPQLQWQMEVSGAKQCALSVIMGASEPIIEYIDRDAEYAHEMVHRGAQFMRHVNKRIPPVILEAIAPPDHSAMRTVDMNGNNAWANSAVRWLDTRQQAQGNKDAEKVLKSMVPGDAKKCHGHGVQITRDRAGRLSLRSV